MWFVVDMLIGVIDGKVIMMRFCSFWYYVGDFVNVFFRKEIYFIKKYLLFVKIENSWKLN